MCFGSQREDGGSCHSSSEPRDDREPLKVQSPLKMPDPESRDKASVDGTASRRLDMEVVNDA